MARRDRFKVLLATVGLALLVAAPASAVTDAPGKPPFDSRARETLRPVVPDDAAAIRARDRLSAQLGREGVLDVDERTGTPRMIARLDGFLTGPSSRDAAQVVLDYVDAQRAVFGLGEEDLASLRLARRYIDDAGITHLIWAQTWRGLAAWDNGLRASVTADGRLISVGGSPVPGLSTRTAAPELNASQALARALGDVGRTGLAPRATARGGADRRTSFSGGHEARLVLFTERAGDVHLAWRVHDRAAPNAVYEHLVDARSGEVLYRENQVRGVTANVFEYAPDRGTQGPQTIRVDGPADLRGPGAYAFLDVNLNGPDSTVPANSGAGGSTDWNYPFSPIAGSAQECAVAPCTWRNGVPGSWVTNEDANVTQLYYFLDTFQQWLETEVGFTDATGGFGPGDIVFGTALYNASGGSRDNAFAAPSPDGDGADVAFFLWRTGRSSTDDPTIVFHEYAHLFSARLIVRADGFSALDGIQGGAMGEGWSDWYGLDYLVDQGLEPDTANPGEVAVGEYVEPTSSTGVRASSVDCPVPVTVSACSAGRSTYADYGGDSVHNDGEIWAQTLWDLRQALGGNGVGAEKTRRIVTEAMRLSPESPSYIDMRNSILLADQALFGGADRDVIWSVFADRGMGFLASSDTSSDASPEADFTDAPPAGGGVTVTGRVTDANTGAPIAGAIVELASLPGDQVGTTDANGDYSIPGMAATTYPRATITGPGYELVRRSISVAPGSSRVDQRLRRNFAAASGGATVTQFDPPDFGSCGAQALIDSDLASVWGSRAQDHPQSPGEKGATIALPQAVDVSGFRIDPGAACGDDDTASTGPFRVETSTDGTTFTEAAAGTFTAADNHRLNEVAADQDGVRFVRFVMVAPQSQAPGTSGQLFLDAAEFEVLGPPPVPPSETDPATQGETGPGDTQPAADLTAPIGALRLVGGQRLRRALRRGLKISVEGDEPYSARLTARLAGKTARRLGLLSRRSRARSVAVADGSLPVGALRRTATLRFTPTAKRILKRQRTLKLEVTTQLTDIAGNSATRRLRVTLRR